MKRRSAARPLFRVLRHRSIYKGRAVNLAVDRVRLPNGSEIEREILYHPGAAVMIPQLGRNALILIRQFRYSAGDFIWEFPAGTLAPGETPLACARRELEEETGYSAKHFRRLLAFYPTPGVSTEVMHLYLATGLHKTKQRLEEDEILRTRIFKIREVGRLIESGRIRDGKTILGFLQYKAICDGS